MQDQIVSTQNASCSDCNLGRFGNASHGGARGLERPAHATAVLAASILFSLACVLTPAIPSGAAAVADLANGFQPRNVVVIDAGHGGHDLGAVGSSGLTEKAVTLSVAGKIKEILAATYDVHLTRTGDYRVGIYDRTAAANSNRADIFVSIHTGGAFSRQSRGFAVFYHGTVTTPEPVAPGQDGGSWTTEERPVPWDSIHNAHTADSKVLAGLMHRRLAGKLNAVDLGIHEASCLVLQGADMPAVLVEIGCLSHPEEEKDLSMPETIARAAEAICEAIQEYFGKNP